MPPSAVPKIRPVVTGPMSEQEIAGAPRKTCTHAMLNESNKQARDGVPEGASLNIGDVLQMLKE